MAGVMKQAKKGLQSVLSVVQWFVWGKIAYDRAYYRLIIAKNRWFYEGSCWVEGRSNPVNFQQKLFLEGSAQRLPVL